MFLVMQMKVPREPRFCFVHSAFLHLKQRHHQCAINIAEWIHEGQCLLYLLCLDYIMTRYNICVYFAYICKRAIIC